jgi:hypothetical protein
LIKERLRLTDIRPGDILILIAAVIFTVYLFKQHWFSDRSNAVEFVSIQVANQAAQRYPAISHQKIKVIGANGESEIEIKQGKARFLHSHCFSQQCVTHGWIGKASETIACLPNQISISLIGRNTEFDGFNY